MSTTVRKVATYVPVTRESLIDAGLATEADIRADAEERAEREARWLARPWYQRAYMRVKYGSWRYENVGRLQHAARALRGIECERD